jgi:hypothetical protein
MTREVRIAAGTRRGVGERGMEEVQMRYRVAFLGGLAAGFVLGARAGRERYEQMKGVARRVADSPGAQQAAGAFQAQATGLAKTARDKVTGGLQDRVPKIVGAAAEHIPGLRHRDGGHDGETGGNGSGSYPYRAASGPGEKPE